MLEWENAIEVYCVGKSCDIIQWTGTCSSEFLYQHGDISLRGLVS